MNVSRLDINFGDYSRYGEALDDAIARAEQGEAAWLEAGGTPVAALVPPEVLRFYAEFHDMVPAHPMHQLDGPPECTRCQILRDNSDWLFSGVDISGTIARQTADTPARVPVVGSGSQNQEPSAE